MAVLCSVEGLNCNECIPRNDTATEIERIKLLRDSKGCTKRASYPQFSDDETGEQFWRCPVALLEPEALAIIEILQMIEAGFLPRSGGALDQDAYLMARVKCARNLKIQMLNKKEK